MMKYIFDTNTFIVLGHFFPSQFPSFWKLFDEAVAAELVISVREVHRELDQNATRPHLRQWIKENKQVFRVATPEEAGFVASVFAIPHFRQLVGEKQRLKGTPVADPFVVASAAVNNGCVVTEEVLKESAAKIPNVCERFSVEYTNLEGFMAREKWQF